MRTTIAILVVTVASLGVPGAAASQESCTEYDFDLRFFPAFHLASAVHISSRPGSAELTVTYGNARTHGHAKERLLLSQGTSETFCSRILQIMAMPQRPDRRMVADGVAVEGMFRHGASPPQVISAHSPNQRDHPADYGIVDALFTVLESVPVSCALNESLEQLALYFHFGLPVRIISEPTYTVRVYGGVTGEHEEDFARLLSSLPTDKSVTFDFTNWDGDEMPHPQLQRLIMSIAAKKNARWVASPSLAGTLQRLGVDKAHVKAIEGPNCPLQRMRFARR
jgi:hypothetical protein